MIEGWFPLLVLWVIVAASWVGWALVLRTPWRDSAVGRMLFGLTLVWAVWWSLILVGSYASAYWQWLQLVQAAAFVGKALVLVWLDVLMVRAQWRPHRDARRAARRREQGAR